MGILNVTPDSFSDGGQLENVDAVLRRAEAHVSAGACILDIGGESTRPGAPAVGIDEELRRIEPAIEALVARGFPAALSVDTSKYEVARAALARGAHIVNDVTALAEPGMAELIANHGAVAIVMHMRGTPRTMQTELHYDDVVGAVCDRLAAARAKALAAGVPAAKVWLDPGLGFAKTGAHNLTLIKHLPALAALGQPVVVGASRKAFLGAITGRERAADRDGATAALCAAAVLAGAHILRVHDVGAVRDALRVAAAVRDAL